MLTPREPAAAVRADLCLRRVNGRAITAGGKAGSVSFGEYAFFARRLPAIDTFSVPAGLLERDTTHRRFRLFFDLFFAWAAAAPPRKGEAFLDRLLELNVIGGLDRIGF